LDLHHTLRFIGPLDQEARGRVERAAETVQGQAPVYLRIERVGHFARARVLWAGPAAPGEGLIELVARLEEALVAQGFAPEPRPFRAHITLARKVRRPPRRAWGAPVPWLARELVLAAGQEGRLPRYGVRRSWLLTGALGQPPERSPARAEGHAEPGSPFGED
ncbi:MAG: RNA 2',3'-cyclic phosphodiesterase, partial [Bdellovibrio bacteriovorus]